ncbi:PIN domain-containing protein [Rudanella paleaurantiibacter]|uniref:Ribonuclease VapC n=1 Tax=Rudanella paleaurantiibacter TaxID=2614655 RepID=A0A7J5TYQ9_9BACT|nr:type II toxin-antitoxin system VapC family toxin [Rudanella paleaurantiibacter]KAB7730211.1 PIN domain-containing protein [Rudanella paleaurantiibacter]
MLLVDTNILIDYLRQKSEAIAFVNHFGKGNLALSPIVIMEVFQGVLNKADFNRTQKALNGFAVLDLDTSVAQLAMQLQQHYVLSHQLSIPDAFIAATALIYNIELRTYNLKDFRFIPGIRLSDQLS